MKDQYVLTKMFHEYRLFWKDLPEIPTLGGMISKVGKATIFNSKQEAARAVMLRGLQGYKIAVLRRKEP